MISDRAKELMPIIQAFANGEEIQVFNSNKIWQSVYNVAFDDYSKYRIKPKPKLVPFTFEDRQYFKNLWVKSKEHDTLNSLVQISKDDVLMTYGVKNIRVTYSQLLKNYEFEDNSPCGKYIND